MTKQVDKKTGFLILGAIVILALIIILYGYFASLPSSTSKPSAQGPVPTYAAQGTLVSGFPQSLVLDNTASVSNSYAINYSSSSNQYTASWSSPSSMQSVYAAYQTYFAENNWTVKGQSATEAAFRAISASNGTAVASVSIAANGTGSQVTVSYLTQ
jgi:hypothetical protein